MKIILGFTGLHYDFHSMKKVKKNSGVVGSDRFRSLTNLIPIGGMLLRIICVQFKHKIVKMVQILYFVSFVGIYMCFFAL